MADKKKAEKEKPQADEEEKKEGAEGEEGAGEGAAAPAKKKLPLKLIIIIAVAAVLLIGGGVAAAYFMGVFGGAKKETAAEGEAPAEDKGHEEAASGDGHGEKKADGEKKEGAVFYSLGEIMVNIAGEGRRQTYLKLVVELELESEKDKDAIDKLKPRIVDNFQTYLRELRLDDLRGSAGLYRLREELLFRVADAVQPIKVKDVLFQQMLVQ